MEKFKILLEKMIHSVFKIPASFLPAAVVLATAAVSVAYYNPVVNLDSKYTPIALLASNKDVGVPEDQAGAATNASTEAANTLSAQTFTDGVYEGSGNGYGGQIKVQVTVSGQKITTIDVLSHPGETNPFYDRATAIIDNIIAAQNLDVDTISGATYSSRGIRAAVKNALYGTVDTNSTGDSSDKNSSPTPVSKYTAPKDGYNDGTFTGSARGFGGTITVKVTIKNGKIVDVTITEHSGETAAYFNKAKILAQRIVSKQTANVDAVSGATYSSNGIIKATQNALRKAAKKSSGKDSSTTDETTTAKKKETVPSTKVDDSMQDGTYTGEGAGYGGSTKPIVASVTIKDGKITIIEITDHSGETESFYNKASAVIDRIITAQSTDVDVVTGATLSSNGIIKAVNSALAKAGAKNTTESTEATEATTEVTPPVKKVTAGRNPASTTASKDDTTTASKDETSTEATTEKKTETAAYKDGTYRGNGGKGFYGDVYADVTIKDGKISSISFSAEYDEEFIYGWDDNNEEVFTEDFNKMKSSIIEKQSTDGVDVVSGATYSSKAALKAVDNALEQAKQ